MGGQPRHLVDSSTSLSATTSNGEYDDRISVDRCLTGESPKSEALATSHTTQIDSYGQSSYPESYFPAVDQQIQPHYYGQLNQDSFFTDEIAPGTSTAVPNPSFRKYLR